MDNNNMNNSNPVPTTATALRSVAFDASIQDAIDTEGVLLANFGQEFPEIIQEIWMLVDRERMRLSKTSVQEPFDRLMEARTKRQGLVSWLSTAIDLLDNPKEDLPEWGAYEWARRLERDGQ